MLLYIKHNFPLRLKKVKLCKIRRGMGISEHAEEIIYTIEHKLFFFCKSIYCLFPAGELRSISYNRWKETAQEKQISSVSGCSFLCYKRHGNTRSCCFLKSYLATFMRAILEKCQRLSSRVIFTFWEHQKSLPAFSPPVLDFTDPASLLWTPVVLEQ